MREVKGNGVADRLLMNETDQNRNDAELDCKGNEQKEHHVSREQEGNTAMGHERIASHSLKQALFKESANCRLMSNLVSRSNS